MSIEPILRSGTEFLAFYRIPGWAWWTTSMLHLSVFHHYTFILKAS